MNDVTFGKLLSSVMLDNKYDRFVKNRRTGKLDTKSLYKVNTSSRLFKRREARKNKHYAVSLVVDCSGSMRGAEIKMAAEAAKRLSHHLAVIGIPHNIVTFNAMTMEIKPFSDKELPDVDKIIIEKTSGNDRDSKYYDFFFYDTSRTIINKLTGKEMYPLFKHLHSPNEANILERQCYTEGRGIRSFSGPSYNADGEAIKFAREKLMKQEGKRLLIHLSDGQPAPLDSDYESPTFPGTSNKDYDLRKEVAITINQGVELYSIGILSDDVTAYYPPKRTGSINNLEQLYPHIIKLIKLNLKRG